MKSQSLDYLHSSPFFWYFNKLIFHCQTRAPADIFTTPRLLYSAPGKIAKGLRGQQNPSAFA